MNPNDAYKFCPRCGGQLEKMEKNLKCSQCSFIFYLSPSPTNAVIIENDKGEVLLVERKSDPMKGYWDLPGGFIEPGETFETSVKREAKEELAVEINSIKIIGVYADTYLFQGIKGATLGITVSAKINSGTITASDDAASYRFFPKNEILQQKIAFEGVRKGLEEYLNK